MSASHVPALQSAYRQWSTSKGKETSEWFALFGEKVTIKLLAGESAAVKFSTGRNGGRSELEAYFADIIAEWEMLSFDMNDFVEEGDHVVALGYCSWKHKVSAKCVTTRKVDIWTFKDGKIAEFEELYDTAKMFAALS